MDHIGVYRVAAQLDADGAARLRTKLEEIAGPPKPLERLEQKFKYIPESNSANLNFAVQTVEFTLLHDSGEEQSCVRYLGSKLHGGITAVEVSATPRLREFLKCSGFKLEADHLSIGWTFETRLGVRVDVYRVTNVAVDDAAVLRDDRMSWLRGNDVLPEGQLICEMSFKCDTGSMVKRKASLETLFNDVVKPFAISQLCPIEL
jgi:hypothetical protein